MKLVSENSEEDIKKRAVAEELERSLERLTINLLRVVAGAGEPGRLLRDIHECAIASGSYYEAHNQLPTRLGKGGETTFTEA